MRDNYVLSSILLFALLFSGCSRDYLKIDKSEVYTNEQLSTSKVVCIDPRFYFDSDDESMNLKKISKYNGLISKSLENYAGKNKIDLQLMTINENNGAEYYEQLLKLKQEMLTVNLTQRTPFNFDTHIKGGSIQKKVFVYPPAIPFEYATLANKYDTPYFSFVGVFAKNKKLILYHIVVDVNQSLTIYREIKVVHRKPSTSIVSQMIYDSYAMMKKELL